MKERPVPRYLHEPIKVGGILEKDEFLIVCVFGGLGIMCGLKTLGLGIVLSGLVIYVKRRRRGFLQHLSYSWGLNKPKGWPDGTIVRFKE